MNKDLILLDHGSGGKISHQLITEMILPAFQNDILSQLDDGAIFEVNGKRLAFSTDSYVVDPIFFPGGNIGDLAVNGTVNDLAMCGSVPLFLSTGLIIEEGFSKADLQKILDSMRAAAQEAGVSIVTGDTKVVQKGAADKIFINTSGIGLIPEGVDVAGNKARPGDHIILSGTIADHGITILLQREGLSFEANLSSDTAPLNHMVQRMFSASKDMHVLRDPTRGGLGTTLNEVAQSSRVGIKIYEAKIPVRNDVSAVCELLGFDPLYIPNEGKLIAFLPKDCVQEVLAAAKEDVFGRNACVIGEVLEEHAPKVVMETRSGGSRIVDMLTGEQLPRIC